MLFRLLLIAVPLLALLSVDAEGGGGALAMQSVTGDELASAGIALRSPGSLKTLVGAEAASEAAIFSNPVGRVLEVKLAYVVDESSEPALNRALWVVSRNPGHTGGCFLHCSSLLAQGWELQPFVFSLTFIDPYSGEVVSTHDVGGGLKPPEGWPPPGWSSTGFD